MLNKYRCQSIKIQLKTGPAQDIRLSDGPSVATHLIVVQDEFAVSVNWCTDGDADLSIPWQAAVFNWADVKEYECREIQAKVRPVGMKGPNV